MPTFISIPFLCFYIKFFFASEICGIPKVMIKQTMKKKLRELLEGFHLVQ